MKIIHTADIHIGSVMGNLPADRAKKRKRELLDTFFSMLNFARENGVSAIIMAGDFFDGKKIAREVMREILESIENSGVDFLYLTGNHDAKTGIDESLRIPENLKRFDAADDWRYFDYGGVCIAGIDISRQDGCGFYEKLRLDKSKFNICVLHGNMKEIELDRLKDKYIDYLALGDIHIPDIEPKRLDARGKYAYSGCIEGRGFDETGERGFFLVETGNGEPSRTFISAAKRRHEIAVADITGLDTPSKIERAVFENTESIGSENIVRVILKGKYKADTQKGIEILESKLNEMFFFAEVKDESVLDMESVDYKNEISLRHEFVKLVNASLLTREQKDKIIEYGIKALRGEEVGL